MIIPALNDLLFSHWFNRKRECFLHTKPELPYRVRVPAYIDAELERLRPIRDPWQPIDWKNL